MIYNGIDLNNWKRSDINHEMISFVDSKMQNDFFYKSYFYMENNLCIKKI